MFNYEMKVARWRQRIAVFPLAVRSPRVIGAAVVVVFVIFVVKLFNWNHLPVGFQPRLTENERTVLLRTAKTFSDAVTGANLSYHIGGGTLLGSRRHHCFVPWDDDFDVYMDVVEQAKISDVLTRLEPEYVLLQHEGRRIWKFFAADQTTSIPGLMRAVMPSQVLLGRMLYFVWNSL